MKTTDASHLDHNLTDAHKAWILEQFADRTAFFIETVELPENLPTVPCGLHGPVLGDEPILDVECQFVRRGNRAGYSRVCERAPRQTRTLTVIGGPPHPGEECVLFTAYGGPTAPREPWDQSLSLSGYTESKLFWRDHALSAE